MGTLGTRHGTGDTMSDSSVAIELHHPPRRRAPWTAVFVVALAAAGTGLLVGIHLTSSRSAPPSPVAMPNMPGMESAPPAPAGAGSQAVYITPARQQLIGVRSMPVRRERVEGTLRMVGSLAYDETRTAHIHTRVPGWIERLYVDYVGKRVRRGEPLFTFYSPDLATAEADYLLAMKNDVLRDASRARLKHWNVSEAQIAELERSRKPSRTITIESPFDGVVLKKEATAGQYLTPETTSFELADLATIWAVGQVFEYEASRLHIGDPIDVEFPHGESAKIAAKIDFIYPDVDPQTRRVRFRAVIDNSARRLKPDTYVTLVWHGDAMQRLVLPKEAVIDTGERKYVMLALPGGYFEPRDVKVGPPIDAMYPVESGVAEGDRVVTSAQFLVDSETNLMSAMQGMNMPGM
jgi:multidrug efflux pump subunit AcrA (membrane-fusion protein)